VHKFQWHNYEWMDGGSVSEISCSEIPGLKARVVPPLPSSAKVTLVLKEYPPSYNGGPIHKKCNNNIEAIVQVIV
jgi:hypothetical protein